MLQKNRQGFYHVGLLSPKFDKDKARFEDAGYIALPEFKSEAFEMRRCVFLMSPDSHMIEIIEQ